MNTSRIALIALTTAAVLGVAACGSSNDPSVPEDSVTISSSETSTSEPTTDSETSTETPDNASADDGGLEAVTAAIAAAESETKGVAYDVDDQDDDGSWEIDLATGSTSIEVEVSADGTITERENDDLDADDRKALDSAKVTITEAIETALGEVDGTFDDAELDEDDGVYAWKVEIDTAGTSANDDDDREVRVDLATGKATVID